MSRDSIDTGIWFGLAIMAIVTFLLNWFVYSEIKHQRDFWKEQYCLRTELVLEFCGQKG